MKLNIPTFRSAVDYGIGDGPLSVAIRDLDEDGVLDLAVANAVSDNVSVLTNSLDRVETVYPKGWSMISLPVDPIDKRLNTLFPDAAVVYGYEQGTGYVRVQPGEDLAVGRGYWILLDEEKNYTLTGVPISLYTHPVSLDGRTMIGGCFSLAQASSSNCNIGVIYRDVQGVGYQRVTGHLEPGEGYWILLKDVAAPGSLTVQARKGRVAFFLNYSPCRGIELLVQSVHKSKGLSCYISNVRQLGSGTPLTSLNNFQRDRNSYGRDTIMGGSR